MLSPAAVRVAQLAKLSSLAVGAVNALGLYLNNRRLQGPSWKAASVSGADCVVFSAPSTPSPSQALLSSALLRTRSLSCAPLLTDLPASYSKPAGIWVKALCSPLCFPRRSMPIASTGRGYSSPSNASDGWSAVCEGTGILASGFIQRSDLGSHEQMGAPAQGVIPHQGPATAASGSTSPYHYPNLQDKDTTLGSAHGTRGATWPLHDNPSSFETCTKIPGRGNSSVPASSNASAVSGVSAGAARTGFLPRLRLGPHAVGPQPSVSEVDTPPAMLVEAALRVGEQEEGDHTALGVAVVQALVSCAAHGFRTSDTPRLLSLAARVLPSLSHERCAQLAVALAQMDTMDDTLRAGLAQRVAQQVAQFTPSQLGEIAWALGAVGYFDLPCLQALEAHVASAVADFDPLSLARVVWCFARCSYRAPQVEDAMMPSALLEHLKEGGDLDSLSEVVGVLGSMGLAEEGLLEAAAQAALENMPALSAECLARLCEGLSAGGYVDDDFYSTVAQHAAFLAQQMGPKDIVRVVWALSEQALVQPDSLARLAARAADMAREDKLTSVDAHTLVTAFNKLGHSSSDVATLASLSGMGGIRQSIDAD